MVSPSLVCEATTQLTDVGLKCIGSEKFVGESREREVEVVIQLMIPEFGGLRNGDATFESVVVSTPLQQVV